MNGISINDCKEWYKEEILKFKEYYGYKKLEMYLKATDLSEKEKEVVLLQYGFAFVKQLNSKIEDKLINYITEKYPEILSCIDVIKLEKPLFKFIWTFYKKDEDLIDKIFNKLSLSYMKYDVIYENNDYLIYIIISIVDCDFNDDVFHSTSGRQVQINGYKPFDRFKTKMIAHGMRWYIYCNPEVNFSATYLCLPVRILELQGKDDDVSWSKEGYREDLDYGFRSSWEANIARLLNYKNIKWKYEAEFIPLDLSKEKVNITPTYIPDFTLDDNSIIEVKGFWDARSKAKMKFVKEQYPDRKTLVIDADLYHSLYQQYHEIISNWEEDNVSTFNDTIQVVGISISNRKHFVDALSIGDELILLRDVDNKYDSNAIKVTDQNGYQVGFVAKDWANILAPKMDLGFKYKVTVKEKQFKVIQCNAKLLNTEDIILPEIFQ